MSRRMDRAGINRMAPQGIANARHAADPRFVPNEKGWYPAYAIWEGWHFLNTAAWFRHYRLRAKWYQGKSRAELVEYIKHCLSISRDCDKPKLP